jgi:hypothetical protein
LEFIVSYIKNNANSEKEKTKTLSGLKPIIELLKKNTLVLNLMKQDNEIWRKSLLVEIANFINPNDQLSVTRYPTTSVSLVDVKWPSENSSDGHTKDHEDCNDH